jgi:LDH2 family malate/lactate/ureidoglycolate dehydrogenase
MTNKVKQTVENVARDPNGDRTTCAPLRVHNALFKRVFKIDMLSSPTRVVKTGMPDWPNQSGTRPTEEVSQLIIHEDEAYSLIVGLFEAQGAPASHAGTVARHLVESSLMGLHSHGVIRVPQYLDAVETREIDPRAEPTREALGPALCRVDGRWGFGQVAGHFAVGAAVELAETHGASVVVARHLAHIGRVGAYTAAIADRGQVGLAFCSGPKSGHWVAPFGGREGRMATNPMSYAFPTSRGAVVADFATSSATEGNMRYLRNMGRPAPEGLLRDWSGAPTTDPAVLYVKPTGTIQPLGGELQGHKGSALGILVDVMATLLAGDDVVDASRQGNNLALIAISARGPFQANADRLADYIRSTPSLDPGQPVMMPGDRELNARAAATSIVVDDVTWRQIVERAKKHGLKLPKPVKP